MLPTAPRRAEVLLADAEEMLARANEARPAGSAKLLLRKQQLALQASLFAPSHRCVLLEGGRGRKELPSIPTHQGCA